MITKLRRWLGPVWRDSDLRPLFAVVCVRDKGDMAPETLAELQSAAAPSQPDWSSFLQPDLFITFFNLSADGTARANAFASKVTADFPRLRIGRAEGRTTVELDARGKPLRLPVGGFINEALRQSNA